jgi:hypothetical protein
MVLIIGGQRHLPVPQTPTQRPKSEDQRCMPPATRCGAAFSRDVPFQDIAIARSRRVFGIKASLCQEMLQHIDAVETRRYLPKRRRSRQVAPARGAALCGVLDRHRRTAAANPRT